MSAQKDLVIGVDSSTTACKAIAWDKHGHIHAETRATFDLVTPHPRWYEQRAEDWWQALCQVLKELTSRIDSQRIANLCITHQRETFVPVDEDGSPLRNAMTWLDERSRLEVDEVDQRIGNDYIHDLTGKGPATTQSLTKLVWLQKHEPDIVTRTYKYLDTHAYLVYHLTGEWATSFPCGDPMGTVDMRQQTWAVDMLRQLDIDPDKFVKIVPPGSVIGEVSEQAAAQTGLPVGLPVIAGAGDGQSAGLGANITRPGIAYLNLGTAVVSGAHAEDYVADRAFRTLGSPIPGAYIPEYVLTGGTFTINWFVKNFGPDMSGVALDVSAVEVLEMAASKLPPGAVGLMLVPYWNAVMPPYWDAAASGMTIGWTGTHGRAHFYRAIMEGIAYEHRMAMDGIADATGQPFTEFILMGGGSRSALWCQIIADVTGKRVTRASTTEATNLGAGIMAAAAAGWYSDMRAAANAMTRTERSFEPVDETHQIYDRLYQEVYRGLFPAVQKYVDRLTELTFDT